MQNFQTSILFQETRLHMKFSEINTPLQPKYFVEVSCGDSKTSFIEMQKDAFHNWHIVPPVDEWIKVLQGQLVAIILKHPN